MSEMIARYIFAAVTVIAALTSASWVGTKSSSMSAPFNTAVYSLAFALSLTVAILPLNLSREDNEQTTVQRTMDKPLIHFVVITLSSLVVFTVSFVFDRIIGP